VWWKREPPPELRRIVTLLEEFGPYLMSISARLDEIAELLREDDERD